MMNRQKLRALATLVAVAALHGCASYYSHYAMFPAANSSGESRMVRLTWQSADYPEWWFVDDKATSIRLETQCSEREWRLTEGGAAEGADCGPGIRACGKGGMDVLADTGQAVEANSVCLAVYPDRPGIRIADLGGTLELTVHCRPRESTRGTGDDAVNVDYIRSSSVPYVIDVKKSARGSPAAKPPAFDESVCD